MKLPELSLVLFVTLSLTEVDCGTFTGSRINWCLAQLLPASSQSWHNHLLHYLADLTEYCVPYFELKNASYIDKILCEYATKVTKDYESLPVHRSPAKPAFAYLRRPKEEPPEPEPVYLNVYDLEKMHPVYQFLKCVYFHYKRLPLYQSSISFRGTEYFYGPQGLAMGSDGRTSFGEPNPRLLLGYETVSVDEFEQMLPTSTNGTTFVPKNYRFFEFNSNSWTNATLLTLYGHPIPSYIEQSTSKVNGTEMGRDFGKLAERYLHHAKEKPVRN